MTSTNLLVVELPCKSTKNYYHHHHRHHNCIMSRHFKVRPSAKRVLTRSVSGGRVQWHPSYDSSLNAKLLGPTLRFYFYILPVLLLLVVLIACYWPFVIATCYFISFPAYNLRLCRCQAHKYIAAGLFITLLCYFNFYTPCAIMKITVLQDVTPWYLADKYPCFGRKLLPSSYSLSKLIKKY